MEYVNNLDLNEIGIKHKFEEGLKRYNRFNKGVLGVKNKESNYQDVDLRTYMECVLKNGSNEEKRELLGFLKGKIKMTHKSLVLEN